MPEIYLDGCRTTPLAGYLKALGVLRLVAAQADSKAKGCWRNGGFLLASRLDPEALERFFLNEYRPTPLIGPWGARSGFYPGSSEKTARQALELIELTTISRLEAFRETILAVKRLLTALNITKKPEDKSKIELMKACRARLPEHVIPWLDATYVLTETSRSFPPLLGTGGNEGSGSYFSGFAQQVIEIVLKKPRPEMLKPALFRTAVPGTTGDQTPGQFDPSRVGGANAGTGFSGHVTTNPWDYVLTLEGTLVFAASVTRQLDRWTPGALSFPFTVRAVGAGYGSSSMEDETKARGETWMPVWDKPAAMSEIKMLMSEGRVELGRRRARNGLDFARSVASLGVDRGITGFERYAYLERVGQNVGAISLGYWKVGPKPRIDLIDDIDQWLDRFRRFASGQRAPAGFKRALRSVERAIMVVCQRADPRPWQDVLIALGQAEAAMVRSPKTTSEAAERGLLRPIPKLRPEWIEAADDGGPEFRIACSLASLRPLWLEGRMVLPDLRGHMVPFMKPGPFPAFNTADDAKMVVWSGAGLIEGLISVLVKRIVEAKRLGAPHPPLSGYHPMQTADLVRFISGRVSDETIEKLVWGLNAVDWPAFRHRSESENSNYRPPPAPFSIMFLAHLPWSLPRLGEGIDKMPYDSSAVRAGGAGRFDDAVRISARRLRSAGLQPLTAESGAVSIRRAKRMTAALMLPITSRDAMRMAFDVTRAARR